jgi:propanol-preferring alcohol dehydrogenase
VAVDIDPAKREAALVAGAGAAIDPAAPDAIAAIAAACGGAPVSVIDFVGAETTAKLGFDAMGKGGTLVTVGLFGGAAPWSLPLITLKSAHIVGVYVGSLTDFAALMDLARGGAITPIPTRDFPLSQADTVLDRLHHGEIVGRAILVAEGAA